MKHPSLKEQPFLEEERRNLMDETPLMLELRHLTDSRMWLFCFIAMLSDSAKRSDLLSHLHYS